MAARKEMFELYLSFGYFFSISIIQTFYRNVNDMIQSNTYLNYILLHFYYAKVLMTTRKEMFDLFLSWLVSKIFGKKCKAMTSTKRGRRNVVKRFRFTTEGWYRVVCSGLNFNLHILHPKYETFEDTKRETVIL